MAHAAEITSGSVVVLYIDQCHLLWDDARGYVWGPSTQRIEIPMTLDVSDRPIMARSNHFPAPRS
jgi:hypothetical protein